MKAAHGLALIMLAGMAVALLLVAHFGFETIADGLLEAGWGLLWVPVFHLLPMLFSSLGWWALQAPAWRGPIGVFYWARWIREAVDGLLPVGQVGGELVGARLLTNHGAAPHVALAGSIVDLTMEVITQFLFSLLGLALLLALHGYDGTVHWLIVGAGVAALALGGFVLAQRAGMFRLIERGLEYLSELLGMGGLGRLAGLHDAIAALHRERRALALGGTFHLLSWIVGAGEVWLALYLLGHPVGIAEALILESLGQAVRSAAFIVPGAFGIQEGGFMVLGGLLGLGPEVGLTLSLVKRVRELVLGLPGLAAWQAVEGRSLMRWAARSSRRADD